MPDRYVGALDQGTTGTRFVVFDRESEIVASAYETHEQYYPEPGRVEHDPIEIVENARATMRRAIEEAGIDTDQIAAMGIANQRETTVAWDAETGDPIDRAIVWQDRRTEDRIDELADRGRSREIREKTGLEPDAYFSATKMEWLLDRGNRRKRAADGEIRLGTIDAWLLSRLADVHATDVTNASRTMLFDLRECAWDADLLAEFDVPRAALPAVKPSSGEVYARLDEDVLGAPVPIAGVLGDQQAALFGQACFARGEIKNTYGTGSFLLANTGEEVVDSEHGLLSTVAFQRAGESPTFALEGSIFTTGAAIEWLSEVSLIDDPAESDRLASAVESTDDVYVVPAFSGLGAPHWDGRARGTIVGLTRGTRREHLVRATIEGIAYRTREVIEAIEADAGIDATDLRVDGGAVSNDALCRIQADILDLPVRRAAVRETTALGAAHAAGLTVDYWESAAELRERWRVDRRFDPDRSRTDVDYDRWRAAVDRARGWARE